jgi:hypothetical protein
MDPDFTMSLPTLPILIIDGIVSYVNVEDLLALSSTCKTLHYHANRRLYRRPLDILSTLDLNKSRRYRLESHRLERLEASLRFNPENGSRITHHTSYSVEALEHAWTQMRHLRSLSLTPKFFRLSPKTGLEDTVSRCFGSKKGNTSVQTIRLEIPADIVCSGIDEYPIYRMIPKLLYLFQGLEILTIDVKSIISFDAAPYTSDVLAQIHCPQLEHLVLKGQIALNLECPGQNLSKLRFLEVHNHAIPSRDPALPPFSQRGRAYNLRTLTDLMEKDIYFICNDFGELPLIPFLYTFETETDIKPLVRWMLQSEIQVQRHLGPTSFVSLNVTLFEPDIRNKALTILHQLEHEGIGKMQLQLLLDVDDRPSLAFLLPKTINSLQISVNGPTEPTVLPAIVRSLPELSSLEIFAYSKGLKRELCCRGSCFRTPLTFPTVFIDKRATHEADRTIKPYRYDVCVTAEGECTWEVYATGRGPYTWDGLKEPGPAGCSSLCRSLSNEIVGLISLNPKLDAINVIFDGWRTLNMEDGVDDEEISEDDNDEDEEFDTASDSDVEDSDEEDALA